MDRIKQKQYIHIYTHIYLIPKHRSSWIHPGKYVYIYIFIYIYVYFSSMPVCVCVCVSVSLSIWFCLGFYLTSVACRIPKIDHNFENRELILINMADLQSGRNQDMGLQHANLQICTHAFLQGKLRDMGIKLPSKSSSAALASREYQQRSQTQTCHRGNTSKELTQKHALEGIPAKISHRNMPSREYHAANTMQHSSQLQRCHSSQPCHFVKTCKQSQANECKRKKKTQTLGGCHRDSFTLRGKKIQDNFQETDTNLDAGLCVALDTLLGEGLVLWALIEHCQGCGQQRPGYTFLWLMLKPMDGWGGCKYTSGKHECKLVSRYTCRISRQFGGKGHLNMRKPKSPLLFHNGITDLEQPLNVMRCGTCTA